MIFAQKAPAHRSCDTCRMGGRVVVVGSINMDVVVTAARLPALGETLLGEAVAFHPGGKGANQAAAAARLGARCSMIGAVGDDAFGEQLRTFLAATGVDVAGVRTRSTATGVASIIVADGDNAIIVAPGANALVSETDVTTVDLQRADVVVTQLEIPVGAARVALQHARAGGATTILNAAPARACPDELLAAADVLVVNESELAALCGGTYEDAAAAARDVRAFPAQSVVVTLGARGAIAVLADEVHSIPAPAVEVVDTTGAGDCFVGALAARLSAGDEIAAAVRFGVYAASLSVQRDGAGPSMPTLSEVDAALAREVTW